MLSEKAFKKVLARKTKVASYYFDATLFGDYWGWFDKRFYHHTGAVSTWCPPLPSYTQTRWHPPVYPPTGHPKVVPSCTR